MVSSVFHLTRSLFVGLGHEPGLYQQDQVPEHFKELYILRGYRDPRSSACQCIFSMFKATNETLNFWTHFLPFLYFSWQLVYLNQRMDFFGADAPYTQPLLAFMVCVCLFPLMSAVAHTFNTMSDEARHICFFFDYAALSIYSLGAAMAYKSYAFPLELLGSTFAKLYIPVATLNAVMSLILSCQTRFMQNGLRKKLMRFFAFAWPYVWDTLPIMYRLLVCNTEACQAGGTFFHWRQFVFAFSAAFLYTSHMPERFSPGSFDIIGHSHQLFHVCSVLGTQDQMWAITLDLRGQRELLAPHSGLTAIPNPLVTTTLLLLVDVAFIALFTKRLYKHTPPPCSHPHNGYLHSEISQQGPKPEKLTHQHSSVTQPICNISTNGVTRRVVTNTSTNS